MAVLNTSGEEINAKIVYYGPGLSGKTTNLEAIHANMPSRSKGKLVSMKTRTDRTLFFDFLPLELGDIGGYPTRFLLYTVPGQVYYNATRKLVLKGVDGVVFVADSSHAKLHENIESLANLEDNLNEHGLSLDHVPWVIQYNKRDAADAMPVADLDRQLNLLDVPSFEAIAVQGQGVFETFQGIANLLYENLRARLERGEKPATLGRRPDAVTSAVDSALREDARDGATQGAPEHTPVAPDPTNREGVAEEENGSFTVEHSTATDATTVPPGEDPAFAFARFPGRRKDVEPPYDPEVGRTLPVDENDEGNADAPAESDDGYSDFIIDPFTSSRPGRRQDETAEEKKAERGKNKETAPRARRSKAVPKQQDVVVRAPRPKSAQTPAPEAPPVAPSPRREPAPAATPKPVPKPATRPAPSRTERTAVAEPPVAEPPTAITVPVRLPRSLAASPARFRIVLDIEWTDD